MMVTHRSIWSLSALSKAPLHRGVTSHGTRTWRTVADAFTCFVSSYSVIHMFRSDVVALVLKRSLSQILSDMTESVKLWSREAQTEDSATVILISLSMTMH